MRTYLLEGLGTFFLVFTGVGSAIFGRDTAGVVGIALTFGLVLLILAYAIGPATGAHVNPAVTLGALLRRRIALADALGYWVAQFAGGIVAAAVLKALVAFGGITDRTEVLGSNGWGKTINLGGALVVEIILTFLFVAVVLLVTGRVANASAAGAAIGLALAVAHLVAIPLTGTSVNPARSLGPAIFEGGTALEQVWLFIVAPLAGGALAGLATPLVVDARPAGNGDGKRSQAAGNQREGERRPEA